MQAGILTSRKLNGALRLNRLAERVAAGDPSNLEGQAARHYWKHLFPSHKFRREKRAAADHLNAKLNYGYAVLRAIAARHIALAGLAPALGLFHRGPLNAFNLADDLMEPYRPLVDGIVYDYLQDESSLGREQKRTLLGVMEKSVLMTDGRQFRLHAAMELTVQSLCRTMNDLSTDLIQPTAEGDGRE